MTNPDPANGAPELAPKRARQGFLDRRILIILVLGVVAAFLSLVTIAVVGFRQAPNAGVAKEGYTDTGQQAREGIPPSEAGDYPREAGSN